MRTMIPIPRYWILVGAACVFLSPVASVFASVRIANNNSEQLVHRYERDQAASRAQAIETTCRTFSALLDVYVETPPVSVAGRGVQQAYLDQYKLLGCKPDRRK